jgi:polysaccharide pyruvyl transferase WcaK-like protein
MKILLINSDLAKNRGDRAIAEGNIELIKEYFPKSHITGISESARRDKKWFGIDFLPFDVQSLKITDMTKLLRESKNSDIVLWGGGEILKDYTNRFALWYWALKIRLVSNANPNIYGVFHGIGPTSLPSSRRLITKTVNRCRLFVVRDYESYQKLVEWGVDQKKIVSSSDPAVFPKVKAPAASLKVRLRRDFNIDEKFLDNFICVGPRSWFHYKAGGFLPYRYKRALRHWLRKKPLAPNPQYALYRSNLVNMVNHIIERGFNVLLIPMHMTEDDDALCNFIKKNCSASSAVKVLSKDTLSPADVRSVLSRAVAMVGFRLHSNILAISENVPSINIYYVDKGRVFFDSIGMRRYSMPIEDVLKGDFIDRFSATFSSLLANKKSVRESIGKQTKRLRRLVKSSFKLIVEDTR